MRKLACLLLILTATAACGKKGPLIYPEMLIPAAPSDISVQQTDTSMKLSFMLPSKDLAGRKLAGLDSVKILKRDEPVGQGSSCSSCTADYSVFRTLHLDMLSAETQRYGSLMVLLDGNVQIGRIYTYRVSAVAKDNQEGALSAPVAMAMVVAPLPPVLQTVSQPTEIQLEFVGLPPREGAIGGYNIYRAVKGESFPLLPVNREPLTGNRFVDVGLERGVTYVYGVRTVVRVPSGGRVESSLSNEVEGKLKDDE
jgi:predicted small lipoprotein YifL